jgi:putative oxidoreductase
MLDSLKVPLVLAGRILLALIFVTAGASKLGNIAGTAGYIASVGLPEVVAGIALIVGFQARWAALALAVFTLVASVIFHAYWSVPEAQKMVQQLMFMKNLAIAGGMFFIAALGAGPLSLDARRARA